MSTSPPPPPRLQSGRLGHCIQSSVFEKSAAPVARVRALKHSERWTAEGQGELKCRPLCNLSSTTFSSFFLLILYTFVKRCFNWHKEKKLSGYLSACSCSMSSGLIFSPMFLSVILLLCVFTSWSLSFFWASVSLCLLVSLSSSSLPASPSAQRHPIPHWLPVLCCVLSLSSLSSYLHLPVVGPSPDLSLSAALSSALTSKVLYVCFVNYEIKISTKQYSFSLENKTVKVHQKTGTFSTNQKIVVVLRYL